jgi:UDP-N-acetylmuramate dehydrogenase
MSQPRPTARSTGGADWRDALPPLRGRVDRDAPLAPFTWFHVGGPAELLVRPADSEDLAAFLAALPAGVPLTVIGAGSNLLVRDGGVPGAVVRLGPAFAAVTVAEGMVTAGAGALDLAVAREAEAAGLTGLEFLSGIPGSIGGAVRMNAGAFGHCLADVLVEAHGLDRAGRPWRRDAAGLGLGYRASALGDDEIVLGAALAARPGDPAAIKAERERIRAHREAHQPQKVRTAGSTFANPPGDSAWRLIDAAGCRGLTRGGARVSEKHCNFLINLGEATAAEIEDLGEEVRQRVRDHSGIELHWEVRRIGVRP